MVRKPARADKLEDAAQSVPHAPSALRSDQDRLPLSPRLPMYAMACHEPLNSAPLRHTVALGALGLAAVAGVWLGFAAGLWHDPVSAHAVTAWVTAHPAWGPLAAILAMVLHAFLPLPAEAIAMVNGALFGLWLGTLLTWCGAMLGAVLSYGLARWLGERALRPWLARRHRPVLARWSHAPGPASWLFVRFIPVISFNLINYVAGLARLPFATFLWTTALGILPLTVATVMLGHRLRYCPPYVWALVAVAGFSALWLKRRLGHHRSAGDGGHDRP